MDPVRIIEIKESVFADNDAEAERIRGELKKEKTFLLNLMSSPGSGKTTTLLKTVEQLKDRLRIGIMEADIDSAVDAQIMLEPESYDPASHRRYVPSGCRNDGTGAEGIGNRRSGFGDTGKCWESGVPGGI